MRVDVFTLFPDLVEAPLSDSIIARARSTGALELRTHNIRTWTDDVHRTVDDSPYGGGAGMVMKADPIVRGVESLDSDAENPPNVLIMSPAGVSFRQEIAIDLSRHEHLVLICGHYEGIDDRVRVLLNATEVSIGDYVLTGGELAAAVIIDAVTRLLPGVIKPTSIESESHSPETGLLEYPQFTRPAVYRDIAVPEVLLGGNHAEIARWRHARAVEKTRQNRLELVRPEE